MNDFNMVFFVQNSNSIEKLFMKTFRCIYSKMNGTIVRNREKLMSEALIIFFSKKSIL